MCACVCIACTIIQASKIVHVKFKINNSNPSVNSCDFGCSCKGNTQFFIPNKNKTKKRKKKNDIMNFFILRKFFVVLAEIKPC